MTVDLERLDRPFVECLLDKAAFEKKYLDLVASLGLKSRSVRWWASALPGKNTFSSKLFTRMFKLACFEELLKREEERDVAVICSDAVLSGQIRSNHGGFTIIGGPSGSCSLKARGEVLTGWLKQVKRATRDYREAAFARRTLKEKMAAISGKKDFVVFRTWADHRSYKEGEYRDPYFKALPGFFSEEGRNVLFATGILSDYPEMVERFRKDDKFIVPLNLYLRGVDIFSCLFSSLFRRPSIKGTVMFEGNDITRLIREELRTDVVTGAFYDTLIEYYQSRRLARSISIERFIYTFENYAWEKVSVMGLQEADPSIKVIGFQHAFVSRNSFKYFPGKGEKNRLPLPDSIVTMGSRTLDIMRRMGEYPDGIFKAGCALRQDYLFGLSALPRRKDGGIFVPLTITVEDTVKVIRFLVESGLGECAEKVFLRFHPATPVQTVLDAVGSPLPGNFIVSENPPIRDEMKRCSVVLYTWTTVCLEALKMGRPAIYLDVNYPLEVDPLFECEHLKDVCREPGELLGKIEKMRNLDENVFSAELEKARAYVDEYFAPVTRENLRAFSG
jgi:hypothetical protein